MPTIEIWSTAPINVGKGPFGVIGAGRFDYLPDPTDPKAKLALALYREGLSANLMPYRFLGFFKVINVIRNSGQEQKHWIRANLQHVIDPKAQARITAIQNAHHDVADYLYGSGRCAVAHGFDPQNVVNPDDPTDLIRLSEDMPVIAELARIAIEGELGVMSERDFHLEHLYELEGFRRPFGIELIARLKSRENLSTGEIPIPQALSLRLRDRDRIELFELMDAAVDSARDGHIRIRLRSRCPKLVTFVMLDFTNERFVFEGLPNVHEMDDGTVEAAKCILEWAQFYRGWFGSNGTVELWDPTTDERLGARPTLYATGQLAFPARGDREDGARTEGACGHR